jgi:hypothetical protein
MGVRNRRSHLLGRLLHVYGDNWAGRYGNWSPPVEQERRYTDGRKDLADVSLGHRAREFGRRSGARAPARDRHGPRRFSRRSSPNRALAERPARDRRIPIDVVTRPQELDCHRPRRAARHELREASHRHAPPRAPRVRPTLPRGQCSSHPPHRGHHDDAPVRPPLPATIPVFKPKPAGPHRSALWAHSRGLRAATSV